MSRDVGDQDQEVTARRAKAQPQRVDRCIQTMRVEKITGSKHALRLSKGIRTTRPQGFTTQAQGTTVPREETTSTTEIQMQGPPAAGPRAQNALKLSISTQWHKSPDSMKASTVNAGHSGPGCQDPEERDRHVMIFTEADEERHPGEGAHGQPLPLQILAQDQETIDNRHVPIVSSREVQLHSTYGSVAGGPRVPFSDDYEAIHSRELLCSFLGNPGEIAL